MTKKQEKKKIANNPASPQQHLSSKCRDLEAFLLWPDAAVKLTYSAVLDACLGSRRSRRGTAAAAGCRGGVAAKGWGPARSRLRAQKLTGDACVA